MRASEFINEAGNPQMVARRISAPRVSTVDYSAPWVQSSMQQVRQRKKEFNELATAKEKFDFLYKLKSGKTTNTIRVQGPAWVVLNIENYNPATGDIVLVGYQRQGRSGSQELKYHANVNDFSYVGREKKGISSTGYNYYFSPGNSLELVSQNARVKPVEPAPQATAKLASPWDILDKKKLKEFAPNTGGGNDYLRVLASAWYNDVFNTGDLHKGIKSQEDVERILERGVICPDGKKRKFGIGYNHNFDGVVLASDDYYEYDDGGVDSRTNKPWGPYEYIEYAGNQLDEQQLDELSFRGSQCTKDCSGHRAGYEWSTRKGGADAASWSPSFNKGAWLHNNGF